MPKILCLLNVTFAKAIENKSCIYRNKYRFPSVVFLESPEFWIYFLKGNEKEYLCKPTCTVVIFRFFFVLGESNLSSHIVKLYI
jgi:hypothetical protein